MLLELPWYAARSLPHRYTVDISQRYHNEIRACSLLHLKGAGVVPFVGTYSTEEHPFGLIYEYMDGLDLNQCLRSQSHVCRLKLVHASLSQFFVNRLMLPYNS